MATTINLDQIRDTVQKKQQAPTGNEAEADLSRSTEKKKNMPSAGSLWEKTKGYASYFGESAKKRAAQGGKKVRRGARNVQTRSAAHDAQRASELVEKGAAETTATIAGITKAAVATSIGSAQGLLKGVAKGTMPTYVKAIQAADNLARAGEWVAFETQTTDKYQTRKFMLVDVPPYIEEQYQIVDNTIEVTGGKNTQMRIDGQVQPIIATPIYDGNGHLVGVFVFVLDEENPEAGGDLLLYETGFEDIE